MPLFIIMQPSQHMKASTAIELRDGESKYEFLSFQPPPPYGVVDVELDRLIDIDECP